MDVAQLPQSDNALQSASDGELKRKRTSEEEVPPPKAAKNTNTLAINYLARQHTEDLPLICNDDALPSILRLLGDYQGVLERHESMACNLGARPLGPILIKRFERLFEGPPKVLKNHGKEGNNISWLDVVEFARNKPEQFTLGQMSEGARVCQFYTKQCRVQISEEDFVLISSGIPQQMIPPQPIVEDEEKELGTLEILEKNLSSICHLADQVAARTRQLRHRINGRKQAILERRATESQAFSGHSSLDKPHSGFLAVNSRRSVDGNGNTIEFSKTGASSSTRTELLSKFFSQADKDRRFAGKSANMNGTSTHSPVGASHLTTSVAQIGSRDALRELHSRHGSYDASYPQAGPIQQSILHERAPSSPQSTGHSAHPHATPHGQGQGQATALAAKEKDNDGPYKSEMVARMETLKRGDRVLPPCDRCRRLHMDCIKNLTACAGCTKKHAKCSWRDVRDTELYGPDAGKIPISTAMEMDSDREPSVGMRPELETIRHSTDAVLAGMESARALALEGLHAAAEAQGGLGQQTPEERDVHSSPMTQYPPQGTYQQQALESMSYDITGMPSPRTETAS
ncbi:hypothetical protein E2P81_ATG10883 [Venturia nashicola]|uniref:C6 finger domain protein n=1 Tax=Venturia nashicola TaxID=86259 RepID=A0A4Z1NQ56_9PEZI|nr:hypothetical protein E6O75_ATG10555 [Venturia nashicola]TLD27595.1 hypothetical protein E2P81_ATG10883 [Venturia nashicola]